MLTSDLNRKIYIQKKTESKGDYGVINDTWYNFIEGYCQVIYNRGRSVFQDDMQTNNSDVIFVIRYRQGVNYDCRVRFDDKIYLIDYIEEMGLRGKAGIKLYCTRRENL